MKNHSLINNYLLPMLLGIIATLFVCSIQSEVVFLIFVSLVIISVSLWLMQKSTAFFDLKRMTITSIWYITYVFSIFLPSFMIFFSKPEPYRSTYMFSVQSVLIAVPIGFCIADLLFKFKNSEIRNYYSTPVEDKSPDLHKFFVLLLVMLFIVTITMSYFFRLKTVPLLYLITHPNRVLELTVLREESFKLLDPRWSSSSSTGMFYIYLFLRTTIYPFLIMVTLGYYLVIRQAKWLALFLGTLLFGLFYAGSSIARAPVAAIFMRIMCFVYIFRCGILSKKTMVSLVSLILLFPIIITVFAYGQLASIVDFFLKFLKRLFYSPAWGLYYYFEIFPEHHNFTYGQNILKPFLQFFTTDFFYVENYVYRYMSPGSSVASGHENDAFISNLYADFGLIGVVLGGILAGILMQGLQIYILRSRKTVLNVAIFSFMIYAFWVLNFGSITSVLFVNGVIPVFFLLYGLKLLEVVLRPKSNLAGMVKDE